MKYFQRKPKSNLPGDELNPEEQPSRFHEQPSSGSNSTPEDLSVSLRAEMLPASNISPDMRKFRSARFSPRKLVAILGFIILIGVGWFLYAGPGRPLLEEVLLRLMPEPQAVVPAASTVSIDTETAVVPTNTVRAMNTPTKTPRPDPSATTGAVVIVDTPTSEALPSPTTASGCIDVSMITLEDLGKTLCVRGVIENFEARPTGFIIAFGNEKGSMYWVSYDLVWEPAKKGLCVEVTGEVMQIASSPVIVFGYQNIPVICAAPE